jgi:hypothetical protein
MTQLKILATFVAFAVIIAAAVVSFPPGGAPELWFFSRGDMVPLSLPDRLPQ